MINTLNNLQCEIWYPSMEAAHLWKSFLLQLFGPSCLMSSLPCAKLKQQKICRVLGETVAAVFSYSKVKKSKLEKETPCSCSVRSLMLTEGWGHEMTSWCLLSGVGGMFSQVKSDRLVDLETFLALWNHINVKILRLTTSTYVQKP